MLRKTFTILVLGGCLAAAGLGTRSVMANEGQANPGAGQGQAKPGFSVDEKLRHLTQELSLTPDQQARLRAVLEERKTAMDSGQPKKQGEWMEFKEKIRSILDGKQRAKFDDMEAKSAERWKQQQQGQKPYHQEQKSGGQKYK